MAGKFSLLKRNENRLNQRLRSETDESTQKLISNKNFLKKTKDKKEINSNFWSNQGGKLFFLQNIRDNDWKPSVTSIFKLLFSVRVASSFWSIISDCDEVYNYWEPLHLLLFGRGFQTWEYSPLYALRSWLYIYLHYVPAKLLFFLAPSKVAYFYVLRFTIGFFTLNAEVLLFDSICKRLGNKIGFLFILFSIFSVGMFNASCAFLPSSFSMTLNTFAMAFYLQEKWFLSILFTCISALVGWPFAVILGLPIALEMFVVRKKNLAINFLWMVLLSGSLTLLLLYFVDSYYYGKSVLAPLNIVLYNVFSKHGSELYGVEPATFYVKNLFLQWNVLLIFGFFSLPLASYVYFINSDDQNKFSITYLYRFLPVLFIYLSTALWIIIFNLQAHKEERFLFPIYPMIALLAAIGVDATLRLFKNLSIFVGFAIIVFFFLSLSRGYALHRNFSGSIDIYRSLNNYLLTNQHKMDFSLMQDPITVCVGKEWHRFPSSFFLPEKIIDKKNRKRYVNLHFIQSEFRGILPKHFAQGVIPKITQSIPTNMNNMNVEEPSRYVLLNRCDFLIDFELNETTIREPNYVLMKDQFEIFYKKLFLFTSKSHSFFRAFYIPLTDNYLKYGNYVLLKKL